MEETSPLFELPKEVMFNVLLFVPNLQEYMTTNKKLKRFIKYIFVTYDKKFSNINKYWKNNLHIIVHKLFLEKDEDAIIFLYNNVEKSRANIAYYAAFYNNTYLINLLYIKDYSYIAEGAAAGNHLYLVKYAVEMGARNYEDIVLLAAKYGNLDVIKYIASISTFDLLFENIYNRIAPIVAEYGHDNIVKFAIENGADNYQGIANGAAKYGNLEMVKFAVSNGANNFNEIAKRAAKGGHLIIV